MIVAATVLLLRLMAGGPGEDERMHALSRFAWAPLFALIGVIDIEERRVLPGALAAAAALATMEALATERIAGALAGGLAGALTGCGMTLGGQLYLRARRRHGVQREGPAFGGGDVLLAGVCGLMVGWPQILAALAVAVFSAGAAALMLLAAGRVSLRSALPYAPFLLLGTLVVMRSGS